MITRIVLLDLTAECTAPGAFAEFVAKSYEMLGQVPGVVGVQIHRAADPASRESWDACLMINFDSIDAVEPYRVHPTHVAYVDQVLSPNATFKKAWNFEAVAKA